MPYVIKYNSEKPTKFVSFPKYKKYIADKKYSNLAKILGLGGKNIQEDIDSLIQNIKDLNEHFDIALTLKDYGISEEEFLSKVDALSELAHEDQCTGANPRYPLVSEIKEIYLKCYYGK